MRRRSETFSGLLEIKRNHYLALQESRCYYKNKVVVFFFLRITLAIQGIEGGDCLSTTQMLKGIIDGCLLAIIKNKEVYGYELAEKLESYGFTSFSEGTIYPLLMRMQKEQLVTSTLRKSTAGPRRKYYSLTTKGEKELEQFIERWGSLQNNVNRVINYESHIKGDDTKDG